MISFVVPAHNEEACLAGTLQAIHDSAGAMGEPYEIIVVDDASTDKTPDIARKFRARVVGVSHRQIAATRNSGARAAQGKYIFFVDADTTINDRALESALDRLDAGAAGGGAAAWIPWSDPVPLYARLVMIWFVIASKLAGFTGGAFMFSTREAFQASGGFNESMYWGEEGAFMLRLKRLGRFSVAWPPVLTSGRRFRKTSAWDLFVGGLRMIFSPRKMMTQRASVEKIWYDSNRADENKMPNSRWVKFTNFAALLILLVCFSGPLWNFIPREWTPWPSVPGAIRLVIGVFLCHVGLIFWPLASFLFVNVWRQKHWTTLLQTGALIAFCIWQGWGAAQGVIWSWNELAYLVSHR